LSTKQRRVGQGRTIVIQANAAGVNHRFGDARAATLTNARSTLQGYGFWITSNGKALI